MSLKENFDLNIVNKIIRKKSKNIYQKLYKERDIETVAEIKKKKRVIAKKERTREKKREKERDKLKGERKQKRVKR